MNIIIKENINTEENDNIEDLDIKWLEDFDKLNTDYNNYYKEDLTFIIIKSLYVNKNNEIEKIKQEKLLLSNKGKIIKEELLNIIKNNTFINKIKYSLLYILKFNIDIEPNEIKNLFKKSAKKQMHNYLVSVKNIDTITFNKSITMFHDINELIIIFYEKQYTNHNKNEMLNNKTKKIFINSQNKKTRRKQYISLFSENI